MKVLSIILGLVLIPALTQTVSKPETVALRFESGFQFMATSEAEKLYAAIDAKPEANRTDEDRRLFAALTVALGTLPDDRIIAKCDDHKPLCETRRGRRLPLQNPDPPTR